MSAPQSIKKIAFKNIDWLEVTNEAIHDLNMPAETIEAFIRENVEDVDWEMVSRDAYRLSEEFIREFADRVDWKRISRSQNISDEFVSEFADKIDQDELEHNNWRKYALSKYARIE